MPKKRKSKAKVNYFQSESQRKRLSKLSFIYGSKRAVAVFTLLILGSVFATAAIIQQGRDSKAAIGVPMAVTCTTTISSGSISSSLNSLSSGQTLCLNGTFNQAVSINKAGVTLASAPGTTARINGRVDIRSGAHNVRILNLYLNGGGAIESPRIVANNALFYGNTITNQGSTRGICFAVGEITYDIFEVQGITIDSNRIFKCGTVYHDQGIYLENVRNAQIRNNYIYDNPDFAIQFYPSAQNSVFENNVVDGNARGITISSEGSKTSSGNIVRNNIITNSPNFPNVNYYWGGPAGSGNRVENNCLWNGGRANIQSGLSNYIAVSGNIEADPMYVDRANKDFRLKPGSPCAGKGPQGSTSPSPTPSPIPEPTPVPTPTPTPNPTPTPGRDTSAPSVSITAPTNGATLSGSSATLTASASDNVGVKSVQFKLNGSNVGNLEVSPPYSIKFNTTSKANGTYSLTALATDTSNNTKLSSPITVTINNSTTPPVTTPNPTPTPEVPTTGQTQIVEANKSTLCKFTRTSSILCSSGVWTWSKSGASEGKFVSLTHSKDSVTQDFSVSTSGNYRVGFVMRGEEYRGAAEYNIYLDNQKILSNYKLSEEFGYYYIDRNLSAGKHLIKVEFVNDKCGNWWPRESCSGSNDRNIWVDQFKLSRN